MMAEGDVKEAPSGADVGRFIPYAQIVWARLSPRQIMFMATARCAVFAEDFTSEDALLAHRHAISASHAALMAFEGIPADADITDEMLSPTFRVGA